MGVPDDSALLEHAQFYDSAKAHAYYLRTRHLKGRRSGSQQTTTGNRSGSQQTSGGRSGPRVNPAVTRHQQLEAQRKALEARLDRLREVLSELVAAAKKRSGVKDVVAPSPGDTPKDTAAKNEAAKKTVPLTAAQKKEKAAQAREAYAKEHPQSLPKELQALQEQIKDIHEQIKAAVADAKKNYAKAHHQTA